MKRLRIGLTAAVLAVALSACGYEQQQQDLSHSSSAASEIQKETEIVVKDVQVKPVGGGINPDAFAYEITASVFAGSNECTAGKVLLGFHQRKESGEIRVVALQTPSPMAGDFLCPVDYTPVTRTIETTVRGMESKVDQVIVENVQKLGRDLPIERLQ